MQVTETIHALWIPFKVPIATDKAIDRSVYVYLVSGDEITLIDCGVSGTEKVLFDYIKEMGRDPKEISRIILTHSHPDHIGAAAAIQKTTGCKILAHPGEKDWIEDIEKQFKERPVPGFHTMVGGPVSVDGFLSEGDTVDLGGNISCTVCHTSGHSKGSITLFFEQEKAMVTGDALPLPNDLPVYEDVAGSVASIGKMQEVKNVEVLLSSWEAPIQGTERIQKRMEDGLTYLRRIHEAVIRAKRHGLEAEMDLCRYVVSELGLPPAAAMPLVARSFSSNLSSVDRKDLFR